MPIVEAVGTANYYRRTPRAKRIQEAMRQAILAAIAEGVPVEDVKTMKARQMAARQRILDEEK